MTWQVSWCWRVHHPAPASCYLHPRADSSSYIQLLPTYIQQSTRQFHVRSMFHAVLSSLVYWSQYQRNYLLPVPVLSVHRLPAKMYQKRKISKLIPCCINIKKNNLQYIQWLSLLLGKCNNLNEMERKVIELRCINSCKDLLHTSQHFRFKSFSSNRQLCDSRMQAFLWLRLVSRNRTQACARWGTRYFLAVYKVAKTLSASNFISSQYKYLWKKRNNLILSTLIN